MRPLAIGLAAALALGALIPAAVISAPKADKGKPAAVDAKARAAGMAATPALMQSLNTGCTVTDARLIGEDKKAATSYYEVACSEGMGFALIAKKDTAPQVFTCLESGQPAADGKPSALTCMLPGNADQNAMLKPFVAKTGTACDITNARAIGSSPKNSYFEVACGNAGYIVQTTYPANPAGEVLVNSCLLYEEGANISCKLTDKATQLAVVDTLAAASGKNCAVKDKRYVLSTKADNYFEVACADGKGYMLQQTAVGGALARTIDCTQASFVGGGCTLTDSTAALTEQAGLYSKLAAKGGFNCDVEKYGMLPSDDNKKEVVELKCKNRPDGAIAIFSTGPAVVYDCLTSELNGYRCSFSKSDTSFPRLSADLKAYGKGSCEVSAVRLVGRNDTDGYVEVACSDGLPGWVMSYPVNTPNPKSKEILSCTQAKGIGGGCKLPTNVKKS